MRHRTDQPVDGASRQTCVRVKGDDVADVPRRPGGGARSRQKGGIGGPSKQSVQLVKLHALTFPTHPNLLPFVPEPAAMEEEESVAAIRGRSIALVQPRDALACRRQKILVARHGFRGRVRPIGEDGEAKVTVRVREVVHFQPLHLLVDLGAGGQQYRDDDHGAQGRRDTIAKLESRQRARFDHGRDEAIHERYRQIRSRDGGQEPEQGESRRSDPGCPGGQEGQREKAQGEKAIRTEVPEGCR